MKAKLWTPCELDVLLHYYAFPVAHPRIETPAVRAAVERWIVEGVLTPRPADSFCTDGYDVTQKGKAMVTLLCCTPLPATVFTDANGEII